MDFTPEQIVIADRMKQQYDGSQQAPANPLAEIRDLSRNRNVEASPSNPLEVLKNPRGAYIEHAQTHGLDYPQFEAGWKESFGDMPPELAQGYKLDVKRRQYKDAQEDTLRYIARRSVPGFSSGFNLGHAIQNRDALDRFQKNEATDDDLERIAQMERLQQIEQSETTGEAVTSALYRVPALLGEGALASLGRSAATTTLGKVASLAGTTARMPSMWLDTAGKRSEQQGGQWYEPKNLAPAYALGLLNTAVLGRARQTAAGTQTAIGQAISDLPRAGRIAGATATGMGEQQVVDAMAGAADKVLPEAYETKTKFGLLGSWLRGDDDTLKHLATQAVTFAAFSTIHSGKPDPGTAMLRVPGAFEVAPKTSESVTGSANPVLAGFAKAIDSFADRIGGSKEAAAKAVRQVHDRFSQYVEANPDANRVQARREFEKAFRDPALRDYALVLADTLPIPQLNAAAPSTVRTPPGRTATAPPETRRPGTPPPEPPAPDREPFVDYTDQDLIDIAAAMTGKAPKDRKGAIKSLIDVGLTEERLAGFKPKEQVEAEMERAAQARKAPESPRIDAGPPPSERPAEAEIAPPAANAEVEVQGKDVLPAMDWIKANLREGSRFGKEVDKLGDAELEELVRAVTEARQTGKAPLDAGERFPFVNWPGSSASRRTIIEQLKQLQPDVETKGVPTPELSRRLAEAQERDRQGIAERSNEGMGQPAGNSATMAELKAKAERGEPVSLDDVFDAAELNPRERHVIMQRLGGRPFEEIAADPEMAVKAGVAPISRERVEQIEKKAREKIAKHGGEKIMSIAQAVHSREKQERAADMLERGRRVRGSDLGATREDKPAVERRRRRESPEDLAHEQRVREFMESVKDRHPEAAKELDDVAEAARADRIEAAEVQRDVGRVEAEARAVAQGEVQGEAAVAAQPGRDGLVGDGTAILIPGGLGEPIAARYEVRELDDLTASNTYLKGGGFRDNVKFGDYPAQLQPRDYTGDFRSRQKVERFAREMVPSYYVSKHADPTNGPPAVARDGTVINGNGRLMSLEAADVDAGTFGRYRDYLLENARDFGLDPLAVAKLKKPVLVRVVDVDPTSPEAKAFAKLGNIATTEALTPVRQAASFTDLVTEDMLKSLRLDAENTFSGLINDRSAGKSFRAKLEDALPPEERSRYFQQDGMLTEAGKNLVSDMLLLKILPVDLVEKLAASQRNLMNSIEAGVPLMLRLKRDFPEADVSRPLNEALEFLGRNPDVKEIADADSLLSQRDMFSPDNAVMEKITPSGRMMLDFLLKKNANGTALTKNQFRDGMKALVTDQEPRKSLFGEVIKTDAADMAADALGVKKRPGANFGKVPKGFKGEEAMQPEDHNPDSPQPAFMAILPAIRITGLEGVSLGGVKNWLQKWFTTAGNFPRQVFDRMTRRNGDVMAYAEDVRATERDMRKALGMPYDQLRPAELAGMNRALAGGQAALANLPPKVADVVSRMRYQVDALTEQLKKEGAIYGDMIPVVDANVGVYLHRSYKAFSDPKWMAEVLSDKPEMRKIVDGFKTWYAAERKAAGMPPLDEAAMTGKVNDLLYNGTAAQNPAAFLAKKNLGDKDLRILMQRKDVPEPLRALWGESTDPMVNYAKSIGYMSHMLANHRFLSAVAKDGTGTFFFNEPTPTHYAEIADMGDVSMRPLAGKFTTPEIEKAFKEFYVPKQNGPVFQAYMQAIGLTKYAKTVASPVTHIRNFLGNVGFAVANGHWRMDKFLPSLKAVVDDTQAGRDYYRRATELGVIGDGIAEGEIKDVINDIYDAKSTNAMNAMGEVSDKRIAGWLKKGYNLAAKLYRAEDSVWKLYAWENEKARYEKSYPAWSKERVEEHAANIVRETYPTYSNNPRVVQSMRANPITGPFVAFSTQVVKTTYNTLRQSIKEMNSPETRATGAARLVGLMGSIGASLGLAVGSRALTGTDADDDNDMRRFMPDWSRDSQLLHLGKSADGKPRYIDLGTSDPHGYLWKPLLATLRGDDTADAVWQAILQAADPFSDTQILTRAVAEAWMNSNLETGEPIYNRQLSTTEKLGAAAKHVGKAMLPGFVEQGRRIGMAATGTPEQKSGRDYDLGREVMASATGQRVQEIDVKKGMEIKSRKFEEAKREADGLFTSMLKAGGLVSDAEIVQAYEKADGARRKLFDEFRKDMLAAQNKNFGMSQADLLQTIVDAGIAKKDAGTMVQGIYAPYVPDLKHTKGDARRRAEVVAEHIMRKFGNSATSGQ